MKILFCGYRSWATNICSKLSNSFPSIEFIQVLSKEDFNRQYKVNYFDLILFIGWSWKVDEYILKNDKCICLHPSDLPLYRGGSPLQNQIIDGVKIGAVTLFLMDNELDHGPIIWKHPLNLDSDNLSDIFIRITNIGTTGLKEIINNYSKTKKLDLEVQDHDKATFCKRRKPEMSEIVPEDFLNYTATEIYNKIRCLQDPYPNAFIKCKDGSILYITKAKI